NNCGTGVAALAQAGPAVEKQSAPDFLRVRRMALVTVRNQDRANLLLEELDLRRRRPITTSTSGGQQQRQGEGKPPGEAGSGGIHGVEPQRLARGGKRGNHTVSRQAL